MKKNRRVFIIAEAGVNHNGSIETAKRMVDAVKETGADAVKFQTFKAENLVTAIAPKAPYQRRAMDDGDLQLDMLKKLELDISAHRVLVDYCRRKQIVFMSSPFDLESIDMLHALKLKIFKIPSGEITNVPYLRKIGALKKRVILSTGMADLKEVRNALDILTKAGTGREMITVLHCTTEYPAPIEDVNLLAMVTIRNRLGVDVGYSDHTLGIEVPIAAIALGASVIEKHFTLDKKMKGPDHAASLEPSEFAMMVKAIRNVEKALGTSDKIPAASELNNRAMIRKGIVASRFIKKGDAFSDENLTAKRPAVGISSTEWDRVIGRPAKKDFAKDEAIRL